MVARVVCCIGIAGAVPAEPGKPGAAMAMKLMLIATETQVIEIGQDGKIVWRVPSGVPRDVWQLANGNVLFPLNQNEECGVRWRNSRHCGNSAGHQCPLR